MVTPGPHIPQLLGLGKNAEVKLASAPAIVARRFRGIKNPPGLAHQATAPNFLTSSITALTSTNGVK